MTHDIGDDELAIVIRPKNFDDDWKGEVDIELVASTESVLPPKIQAQMLNIATMMSAFLDVATEHPEVYDLVEEHRNYLMELELEEEKPLDVIKDGNVYTLDRWTKTKGNA
tara:strand:+ start:199 stop:531 length:333 start_codon:yes stop_codon:yes gene_type:complete